MPKYSSLWIFDVCSATYTPAGVRMPSRQLTAGQYAGMEVDTHGTCNNMSMAACRSQHIQYQEGTQYKMAGLLSAYSCRMWRA